VSSLSLDLSNTYTEWARRNWTLNGIDPERHAIVRDDVFTWLRRAVDQALEFDLIVLDPPSFSNSKRMAGILDVQRDHPWLIRQCLALLSRHGELFFSTNLRSFELDGQVQTRAQFEELSPRSIPEDFRDRKVHRLWHIRK
jgi:23S rRNA (cytosine1962-C5)-methyltransferase